ncbi:MULTISPECIES: O-antigen ligase [unclassified Moorena]|uniref:O-antigen ligase family protein n=1 Tax=unclassified Moorena TaxID=2683338 RepID=UPI00140067DF|nr:MULTISPECIES: O-antigen ligase [unclassified Moorena]NEO11848.1 O-antigen ligase family protein [Moorena sp. SIO3E8]NEP98766.1 O-antigen ligase family protein [Moorena sp. SIO3F7]
MRKLLAFFEPIFTTVSLVLYSGGVLTVILSGGRSEGDVIQEFDSSLSRLLFVLIYLVTFFLLALRWKKVLYVLSKDRWLSLLVGIAVVSVLWSSEPTTTINRAVALIGTTLFGVYLASRYTMKEQLEMLAWAFGVAILLSFMFIVALPKYGIMGGVHAGTWRGIYVHKNVLGKVMVPSAVVFLLLAIRGKKNNLLFWCGFGFSVILLLFTTSKTALVSLIIMLLSLYLYRMLRWRYDLLIPTIFAMTTFGGSVLIWLLDNADALLGAIGKDATLTGRTELWPFVLDMIEKQPWLGYGYGSFWNGFNGESAYVWRAVLWPAPNAHNGLLDLWLALGILGVSIYLIGFSFSLLRAIAWLRVSKTSENLWPLLFLTYTVLANITETSVMIQNNIFWVLYTSVALSVLIPLERQQNLLK